MFTFCLCLFTLENFPGPSVLFNDQRKELYFAKASKGHMIHASLWDIVFSDESGEITFSKGLLCIDKNNTYRQALNLVALSQRKNKGSGIVLKTVFGAVTRMTKAIAGHLFNQESDDRASHFWLCRLSKRGSECVIPVPLSLKFRCSAYQIYARHWIFKRKVEVWICSQLFQMNDMKYKCNELAFPIGRIAHLHIARGNI